LAFIEAPIASARHWLRAHLDNSLYRTGYLLMLGTGTTAVLGVAFWALAAHAYSAHAVGVNSAVIAATTLVSSACTLGLNAVLVRYLPVAGVSTRGLIVKSYALTIGLSLVVGEAAALTSQLWSSRLGFLAAGWWLIAFPLATAAITVFTLQDGVLIGLRAARWIPIENATYAVAKLILLGVLSTALPGVGLFVAWNAPLPLAILFISVLIFRRLIPASPTSVALDRKKLIAMAKGNYLGTLAGLVSGLYMPILVANHTDPAHAAYFYIPWMIALALQLVAINVSTSLTVEAAVDPARLSDLTRKAFRHSMLLVSPPALATLIAAPWMLLAFGSAYADGGAPLLRLLAISLIPNVIVALGVTVARIEQRGVVVLAIQGAQSVLAIGLSAALLPTMGISGVGVAWIASQSLLAVVLLAGILRPLLPVSFRPR
jgi:O-antigen/teichoic acid export membrane protein